MGKSFSNIQNNNSYVALDCIPVGICIIDMKFQVVFWNEQMEEYTGVNRNEILEKPITDFFPAFNDEFIYEQINNIFDGWPPVVFSSRLHEPIFNNRHNLLKKLIQEIKVGPYPTKQKIEKLIISVEDVTDIHQQLENQKRLYYQAQEEIELRKTAQAELEASEKKLKEIDKMKNQLFSIIGHDLRSPIASLMQFSELFIDNDRKAPPARKKDFQLIYDLSKNSLDLLNNLLGWAKVQMGGTIYNPGLLSLEDCIYKSFSYYQNTAIIKKIKLINKVGANVNIYADVYMLNTILRNLLGNAIKYTFEEGEIVCDYQRVNNKDIIKITDKGIGMDDETRKRLFSDEKIVSEMGTKNEIGTGLGLILCRKYIEFHKGNIRVESQKGKGTTFFIELPASSQVHNSKQMVHT